MKKLLSILMFLSVLCGCSNVSESEPQTGSIYGVVSYSNSAEPVKGIGVELYTYGETLLLKTVTSDDGSYTFENLESGNYTLKVVSEGYETVVYEVYVESGRQARADMQLVEIETYMTVGTNNVSYSSVNTITLNGWCDYESSSYKPTEYGFVYSLSSNPKKDGNKLTATNIKNSNGVYVFSIVGDISESSKGIYYVQAYAKNSRGITYGDVVSFEITGNPAVETSEVTNITDATAILNGVVVYDGSPAYTEKGFVYSSSFPLPTIDDAEGATIKVAVSGTAKEFSANISELTNEVLYYVRAYITNESGTFYGQVKTFTAEGKDPIVKTASVTNLTYDSATLNGTIEFEGIPAYSERGFVYSSSYTKPTVNDPSMSTIKLKVDGTSKTFSVNVGDLNKGVTYYVRAYATNKYGSVYGDVLTFTPEGKDPIVVTSDVTNITEQTATLNAKIEEIGLPEYSERGFLYSSSYTEPTINDPITATKKVVVSGNTKEYSANLSGLTEGVTYYVRAYVTNKYTTTYGEVKTFTPNNSYVYTFKSQGLMVMRKDANSSTMNWSSANTLCNNLVYYGYSDWRLPTKEELAMIYSKKDEIGGFSTSYYWTSSYRNLDYYFIISFYSGGISYSSDYCRVRAVRAVK